MYDLSETLVHGTIDMFKKTRKWLKLVKRIILSKYELVCKHETLFKVSLNSGPVFYVVGTIKPGTLDRILEPITFSETKIIEYVDVSHMGLVPKRLYGPFYVCNGDRLNITYDVTVEDVKIGPAKPDDSEW
jgi:hypothetical protein